jgi:secreted trypsin-like serine protease
MRTLVRALITGASVLALVAPAVPASADPIPHIVGGTNATEAYPFAAVLSSSHGWGCGASLIRPTWILTAGHCVTESDGSTSPGDTLTFRIGSMYHSSGGTVAQGKRAIKYPSGGPDTALVELTAPVAVKPIKIATSAPVGTAIRILGWGCTQDPGCSGAEYLQQLDTSVLPDTKCFGESVNSLCIDNPDGWRGACYGDSGGPGIVKAGNEWVLAGDTSGGTSAVCGQGPSLYAELPTIRSWIESYAGPDGGGSGATNLALNRPTKSDQTTCNADETTAKAVNGSTGGGLTDKWCSNAATAKSIAVDLGAGHQLTSLVIKHAGAGGESASLNTKNFTLETSADGGAWTTVVTVTNNTASTTTHPVNVNARWIRLTTTDPIARIYEFEAY